VEVIPFRPEHAHRIMMVNGNSSPMKDREEIIEVWMNNPSYTLLINDEVTMCSGIVLTKWRNGEAWTLTSPLFYKYTKTCFKIIREYLDKIIEEHNLKRVQSLIESKFAWKDSWMDHLGFQKEGVLRCFGPNDDYVIYSRVRR
jgi:hypothetical protein